MSGRYYRVDALWQSSEDESSEDIGSGRIAYDWVDEIVQDDQMNCGGRQAMDVIIHSDQKGELRTYCGRCAVRQLCVFGRATK
jgi:hypothetical protein